MRVALFQRRKKSQYGQSRYNLGAITAWKDGQAAPVEVLLIIPGQDE
jgi:hypothetical protein